MTKLIEIKSITSNKDADNTAIQMDSMLFFQAQQDIKADIIERRNDMMAKSLFDEEKYELYKKFKNPWYKNDHNPTLFSRGYSRRHGLNDGPLPSKEDFLKNYRAHYDLLQI